MLVRGDFVVALLWLLCPPRLRDIYILIYLIYDNMYVCMCVCMYICLCVENFLLGVLWLLAYLFFGP